MEELRRTACLLTPSPLGQAVRGLCDRGQRSNLNPNLAFGQAMMGLCDRGQRCNVPRAMRILSTFDFVGFAEHLDVTFEVLKGWVNCSREANNSLGSIPTLIALERAIRKFRPERVVASDPSERLARNQIQIKDSVSRKLAKIALEHAPSPSEFRRHHRCALTFYDSALKMYGRQGITLRPQQNHCS